MEKKLEAARAKANKAYDTFGFKSAQYEKAMKKVRSLVDEMNAKMQPEEFCSVDSGFHRTRLLSGRIV